MKKISFSVATLLLAGSLLCSSCIGSFALFNKYEKWQCNMTDNKFVNAIVGFILQPIVGGVCLFVDAVVLNTIEFWTGSNPLASGDSYHETDAQGNSIAAVKNADGTMSVEVTAANGEKANLTLQRDENVVRALDAEGNLVAQYEIEK